MSDKMYGRLSTRGGSAEQHVVRLEQVPRWIEQEPLSPSASHSESEASDRGFVDLLTSLVGSDNGGTTPGTTSKFHVNHDINAKLYIWRGAPWALEVDAVVNSANENLDEAHSSPDLHPAAGPGLAEECATLWKCIVLEQIYINYLKIAREANIVHVKHGKLPC